MRYIVVEENVKDRQSPNIRVFAGRERAVEYANESENECRLYRFGSTLAPEEIEADRTTRPE
jgi:hypothetical protein